MKQKTAQALKQPNKNENDKAVELAETLAALTAVLTIVEEVIPRVNKLVEDNIGVITSNFEKIATTSKALARYFELTNTDVSPFIKEIEKSIGNAIMGIQFQDRLSQNLVILQNISQVSNQHIKGALNIQQNKNGADGSGLNLDLSKKILENLKLGEVREVFVNYLVQNGLIKDAAELGYTAADDENKKQHSDDIELF
jgi:hypothetical protein